LNAAIVKADVAAAGRVWTDLTAAPKATLAASAVKYAHRRNPRFLIRHFREDQPSQPEKSKKCQI
jgi:hypothetical protein